MKKLQLLITKNISTVFLRLALVGLGLFVLVLCLVVLPAIYSGWSREFPDLSLLRFPVLVGLGTTAIAFFVALFHSWRLLGYIDTGNTFSLKSVRALRAISYCAGIIAVLYTGAMPIHYNIAQEEDAPGLIIYGALFVGIPAAIAVFARLVEKLLQQVIAIKSENDLTV